MAHAGKEYPLHFRRDLTLNVQSYIHGPAKGYNFRSQGPVGSVGTALKTNPVLLIEVDPLADEYARWESEWVVRAARHIKLEMICNDLSFPSRGFAIGNVIDQTLGHLGSWSNNKFRDNEYQNFSALASVPDTPHPTLWLVNPFEQSVLLTAMSWPQFNSLP